MKIKQHHSAEQTNYTSTSDSFNYGKRFTNYIQYTTRIMLYLTGALFTKIQVNLLKHIKALFKVAS